ncbi:GntR family transcriptional regulator [Sinosporangium siamense]|uniref:GntR family transcriptional regulator n=1 Tax=Sinosporangium siamense TaxID=1367973 RepID=A0A919RPK4_9ACTN|nr:GntR family transcriptional regulator [Sinosporangium siamense]GII97513.1 GntR family transcriptional regulator [Sinosporangium siamense]
MSEPRYLRIVAELRGRIYAGELAEGDRVPATREIMRTWGVAMATATKVLHELRRQGLVRVVPGVGTVVGGRARAPLEGSPDRAEASGPAPGRERIVSVALAIADEEGIGAVSLRRVAGELGVDPVTLHQEMPGNDKLLEALTAAVWEEFGCLAVQPEHWRTRLLIGARALWGMFKRHPWFASEIKVDRPAPLTASLPIAEWLAATFHGHEPHASYTAFMTMFHYVRGIALMVEDEAEAQADSGLDRDEWLDAQEPSLRTLLDSGRYPAMRRIVGAGATRATLDEHFEGGLHVILDGIAPLFGDRPRSSGPECGGPSG